MAEKTMRVADALRMIRDAGFDWDTGDWEPLLFLLSASPNGDVTYSGSCEQIAPAGSAVVWFVVDQNGIVTTPRSAIERDIAGIVSALKKRGIKSHQTATT